MIFRNSIKKAPFDSLFIDIFIKDFNVINIDLYCNVMELIEFYVAFLNRINNYVKFIYGGVSLVLIRLFIFFGFY